MANSWRRERWDSLRLLTPNWQIPAAGISVRRRRSRRLHDDAGGGRLHHGLREASAAPVRTHTTVTSVRPGDWGYRVVTEQGELRCRAVVLASGACNVASVPALRQAVPSSVACVDALGYRNPEQLPPGGVLVVGASATGVQLADEIRRSGRPVTLAVGEHVRLPRTYRGRDVLWWMEHSGVWNQRYDEIDDVGAGATAPVAAAGRHTGAHDARPQHAQRGWCGAGWPAGDRARRAGAVLGRPAQPVRAGRPQDGAAPGYVRRVGAHPRSRCRRWTCRTLRTHRDARVVAAEPGSGRAGRSGQSSGRPGFDRTTAGCTCRWSIRRAISGTTVECWRRRDSMPWGCRSSGGASRPSSTAPRTTRAISSITWPATLPTRADKERPLKTLERVLSKAGVGSRVEARRSIHAGRVKVNGTGQPRSGPVAGRRARPCSPRRQAAGRSRAL